MKHTFLALSLSLVMFGCTKDEDDPPAAPPEAEPTQMELLTGKQWTYTEVYTNATSHKNGTLVYQRGGSGNTQNHNNTRALFWQNGAFDELEGPTAAHNKMTWQFIGSDSTAYRMSWGSGSTDVQIVVLDEDSFEWYNPTQQMSGVMVGIK